MAVTAIRTKDYRSDIVLTIHMTLGGETVNVPQHDFLLRFFTENNARHYDCGRIKGEWQHCAPDESDATQLTCYIKNHGLGCGMLQCTYIDLSPNDGMEDGVQRTFSVSGLDLELVDDASDDTQAVEGEVAIDINSILTELHALVDAAEASQQKNVASIVYQASDQPGGQNIITITLNNGTVIIGTVLNGKGADEDYVKDVKLNGRSVVTNKGVALITTEASQLPALVTIGGMRKENVLDALVALNQYISSVEESIGELGGETELVFGSLNGGIFYDINGNEAVRSDTLLYVDRSTGIIYRWGANSFAVASKEPMDSTPTNGSQKPVTSGGVYNALTAGNIRVTEIETGRAVPNPIGSLDPSDPVSMMAEKWPVSDVQAGLDDLVKKVYGMKTVAEVSIQNGEAYPVTHAQDANTGDWEQIIGDTAVTPEFGRLYADITTSKLYMWNGTSFTSFS